MLFRGYYQNGYITHDLDMAMDLASRQFGLADYVTFDPTSCVVRTPNGDERYDARVAMAWSGDLQVELIQPLGDTIEFYRDVLPQDTSDFRPRFHHVAVRRPDLELMRREIAALGLSIPLDGTVPGMTFIYVDTRSWLGHFLELVWGSDEIWSYLGWPAGKPVT